ncbi:ABC transporter ATP-binding protein [Opitutus sp. ER46]|uniref:ABC transporter ATP-binding protein n=1 Tax=Opitutus sp. ER46 TaxID=2161864 RepID=UPI0011B1D961|nr:ABC transporter ATP-binding protein [Opitutus sp. ER46]
MSSTPLLQLQAVTRRYGPLVALDDVSLEIHPGEFFGLLGPNGAGKSTLMSLASGLRRPDQGTVIIDGQPLTPRPELRGQLGLVPQNLALYPDLTAEENLRIFGELQGLRGADLRARLDEAFAAVQLSDRRKSIVKEFSGGMQRRLNLVAALLHRPKLLLCDEPTVGVDPQSRNAIFEYLQQLNRAGVTIVYSTHYMEEAERLCSRVGVIDHGRILALGTVGELLNQLPYEDEISFPAGDATAALVGQLGTHGTLGRENGSYHFRPRADYRLSAFFALTESLGLSPRLFVTRRPSLEAVFLHLTGRNLRDN